MGASTAYGILTHQDSRTRIDYELETRFYKPRDLSEIPVHKLNFVVWRQSMQVRFFLEMIVFFANVCLFNWYLTQFVINWNSLGKALDQAKIDYDLDIEEGRIVLDPDQVYNA